MPAPSGPRWGYHQLSDQVAKRLVAGAAIGPGDLVLDIGAGDGVLARHLLAAGARVVAIELHAGRAHRLRARFGQSIAVVEADASQLRLPHRPFRVVANPPFGIAVSLLGRLVSPSSRLISADLILPAHLAARWAAGRGPDSRRCLQTYGIGMVARLPSSAFRPPAPSNTAVLRIERRRRPDRE